jgi:hypothetical protein
MHKAALMGHEAAVDVLIDAVAAADIGEAASVINAQCQVRSHGLHKL